MGRQCGSCGGGGGAAPFRQGSDGAAAAQAGASTTYEVLNASGAPTGRTFDTLTAATGYANRIGGSTRPV